MPNLKHNLPKLNQLYSTYFPNFKISHNILVGQMAVKTVTASSNGEGKHINNHQNISTTQFLS